MFAWWMIPALLSLLFATAARGDTVNLLNDIPLNTVLDEGSTFVLLWEWDGDATGVGKVTMSSFKEGSTDDYADYVLEENLNLTTSRYPWTVKAPSGRDTLDWYCSLGISYNDGYSTTSGRSFKIKALPQTSSSSSSTATSLTTTTSSATSTSTADSPPRSPSSGGAPGLKGNVLAGLVVGVVVGVGGLVAIVVLFWVYRRRKARRETGGDGSGSDGNDKNGEDDGSASAGAGGEGGEKQQQQRQQQYQKPELDAAGTEKVVYELDGADAATAAPREVDAVAQEVDGGGGGGGGGVAQEVDAVTKPTELDSNARSELVGDGDGDGDGARKSTTS